MIRPVAALLALAVGFYAVYLLISMTDFVQVKTTGALNKVAEQLGYGGNVTVPAGYNLHVSRGTFTIYGSARTATALNITDTTCVAVNNETWQWHGCGPAVVPLSPGSYQISVVRYPPLRRDFADTIAQCVPLLTLAVLVLVVIFVYERWR
jgi:hypothetical protein